MPFTVRYFYVQDGEELEVESAARGARGAAVGLRKGNLQLAGTQRSAGASISVATKQYPTTPAPILTFPSDILLTRVAFFANTTDAPKDANGVRCGITTDLAVGDSWVDADNQAGRWGWGCAGMPWSLPAVQPACAAFPKDLVSATWLLPLCA